MPRVGPCVEETSEVLGRHPIDKAAALYLGEASPYAIGLANRHCIVVARATYRANLTDRLGTLLTTFAFVFTFGRDGREK